MVKSKRLVDYMVQLIDESGLPERILNERFKIGRTWIYETRAGKKCPSSDKVQEIIEGLSGKPLLKDE